MHKTGCSGETRLVSCTYLAHHELKSILLLSLLLVMHCVQDVLVIYSSYILAYIQYRGEEMCAYEVRASKLAHTFAHRMAEPEAGCDLTFSCCIFAPMYHAFLVATVFPAGGLLNACTFHSFDNTAFVGHLLMPLVVSNAAMTLLHLLAGEPSSCSARHSPASCCSGSEQQG
jgi:hypothetical protein